MSPTMSPTYQSLPPTGDGGHFASAVTGRSPLLPAAGSLQLPLLLG